MEENQNQPPLPPVENHEIVKSEQKPSNFKSKLPFLVIAVLLVLVGIFGGYFVLNQTKQNQTPGPAPDQKACTQEAKVCPDGSSVGRTGPNCEFATCPTPTAATKIDETADWKVYTNSGSGYSIKYPGENYVRLICPDEELTLKTRTATNTKDEESMETCGRGGRFEIEVVTASSFTEPTTDESVSVTKQEIMVAGVTARKYISTRKPAAEGPIPDYSEDIYFEKDGKKHLIHFGKSVSEDIKNSILSTFKTL